MQINIHYVTAIKVSIRGSVPVYETALSHSIMNGVHTSGGQCDEYKCGS